MKFYRRKKIKVHEIKHNCHQRFLKKKKSPYKTDFIKITE
jgi:hypothetical protein